MKKVYSDKDVQWGLDAYERARKIFDRNEIYVDPLYIGVMVLFKLANWMVLFVLGFLLGLVLGRM
jgi:hypothetical protein